MMSTTIDQLVEVITEVLETRGGTLGSSVSDLRRTAVAVVAERRGVEPNTIADKYIRGLAPDVTSSAQFDRLLEDWLYNRSERLLQVMAAHAGREDRALLQTLKLRRSGRAPASRTQSVAVDADSTAAPRGAMREPKVTYTTGPGVPRKDSRGERASSRGDTPAGSRSGMRSIADIVAIFAAEIKAIDDQNPVGKSGRFRPGVGPLTETELTHYLSESLSRRGAPFTDCGPRSYPGSRNTCDLVLPGQWTMEIKLARPFGDNGKPAERWAENLLYPYRGNTSLLGDCTKLLGSAFRERLAVIVVGYEHVPPVIPLEPAIRGFELLATHVMGVRLSPRATAFADELVHPVHQRAIVYGWEVLRPESGV
jgi:hypothetical protein